MLVSSDLYAQLDLRFPRSRARNRHGSAKTAQKQAELRLAKRPRCPRVGRFRLRAGPAGLLVALPRPPLERPGSSEERSALLRRQPRDEPEQEAEPIQLVRLWQQRTRRAEPRARLLVQQARSLRLQSRLLDERTRLLGEQSCLLQQPSRLRGERVELLLDRPSERQRRCPPPPERSRAPRVQARLRPGQPPAEDARWPLGVRFVRPPDKPATCCA